MGSVPFPNRTWLPVFWQDQSRSGHWPASLDRGGDLLGISNGPSIPLSVGHQNVICFSPHSLQAYGTRTCPGAAETRFGAPHFPHFVSMRVCPCLMVTVFRFNASFTNRSVSSRIACFDISRLFAVCTEGPTCDGRQ